MQALARTERKLLDSLCANDAVYSDTSGLSNKDKWQVISTMFECDKATVLDDFQFESIYNLDSPALCEAAGFVADLRAQFFDTLINADPSNLNHHRHYLENRQWQARFRERSELEEITVMLNRTKLL